MSTISASRFARVANARGLRGPCDRASAAGRGAAGVIHDDSGQQGSAGECHVHAQSDLTGEELTLCCSMLLSTEMSYNLIGICPRRCRYGRLG